MKKIFQISLLLVSVLAFSQNALAQKKMKEGSVVFTIDTEDADSPEMMMMAGTTLTFYFNSEMQRMDMNMMGGMMRIQTFSKAGNSLEATMFMDMMGKKIQISELNSEEMSQANNYMNFENATDISYDEKDKKKIAGYDCYKAIIKTKEGQVMSYYITEKITPPATQVDKIMSLKGYPLEMTVDTGQGMVMTFVATEVNSKLNKTDLEYPTGYQKMTMEEFQNEMGGAGGFGN
ncbi:MAG: DUF4412 domain-containing protein [Saprospiraceae bacterium]